MYIEMVSLKSFRNFDNLNIELSDGVNVFLGDNAQGKTNFLESIYMCSIGRSWRTHLDREMISFKESEAHIRTIVHNNGSDRIDVHLKKDGKKGVAVNGLPIKKIGQLFGRLLTVVFSPEDLQLIKSGPSERRRFMDMELCQLGNIYYYELQQYHHVLKQRNNLLKSIKSSGSKDKDTIFVWDDQLVAHGARIMQMRFNFINKLDEIAQIIHLGLTNEKESLKIIYKPNVSGKDFLDKLKKNLDRDIARGSTSVGIHKDDIDFLINGLDARIYGSQGQQRTVALSSKLAEIELIKEETQNEPVLLLDDVLSELDESRQRYFLNNMAGVQTLVTCTGIGRVITSGVIYTVKNGIIGS